RRFVGQRPPWARPRPPPRERVNCAVRGEPPGFERGSFASFTLLRPADPGVPPLSNSLESAELLASDRAEPLRQQTLCRPADQYEAPDLEAARRVDQQALIPEGQPASKA